MLDDRFGAAERETLLTKQTLASAFCRIALLGGVGGLWAVSGAATVVARAVEATLTTTE